MHLCLLFSAFALTGCGRGQERLTCEETHKIIFDMDTVACNAMALIIVAKALDEAEILTADALTNVAKAIEKDPETMQRVKRFWSMGISGTKYFGNANPAAEFNAEFNAYTDIAVYDYVVKSIFSVTTIGNNVCDLDGIQISSAELADLRKSGKC